MKPNKIILSLLLCAAFLVNPITVWASPIDNVEVYDPAGESDEVVFTAGEHQASQSGEGNTITMTEEERNIASQNTSIANEQRRMMQSLVSSSVENTMSVYIPGTSLIIREDVPITWQDLMAYIQNGLKYETVPGLRGIAHSYPSTSTSENTNRAMESLKDDILGASSVDGILPFDIGGDLLTWEWLQEIDTAGWTPEMFEAWQEILRTHNWTQIRTDLVGGGIIDWPYQELRYEILKAYASSLSMADLIETTAVTEYRVSNEEVQKIISKQPVSEYKWEICDSEGNILKTTHTYGRTLRLSFSKAGTYYIRAFQKHYVTRADVISTKKLEYWVLSKTKQLLWSSQLEGRQFTYNRNTAEEFIGTNYIMQEITASMLVDNWIFNLDPSGQLQIAEGFQVERIK